MCPAKNQMECQRFVMNGKTFLGSVKKNKVEDEVKSVGNRHVPSLEQLPLGNSQGRRDKEKDNQLFVCIL